MTNIDKLLMEIEVHLNNANKHLGEMQKELRKANVAFKRAKKQKDLYNENH